MNILALKKRVLDLAIRGKLLKLEKTSLPKDLKEKDLPKEAIEEMAFPIPEHWACLKLADIGSWNIGLTPKRSRKDFYEQGTIPWLKTGELNDSYINSSLEKINPKVLEETRLSLNPKGSILIAMYGATVGRLGIANIELTTNQACCACLVREGVYNLYLFYYLLSQRENFLKISEGAAQKNISKRKLTNYPIPLPPLNEQKAIVKKIKSLFFLLDYLELEKEKITENLEKIKKELLDLAIRGLLLEQREDEGDAQEIYLRAKNERKASLTEKQKDNFHFPSITKENQAFEIPKNWHWVYLQEIVDLRGGKRIPKGYSYAEEKTAYPYLRVSDMKEGTILRENLCYIDRQVQEKISRHIITSDDIYISIVGTVGEIGFVPEDLSGSNFTENAARMIVLGDIKARYLYYFLKSSYSQDYFQTNLNKSAQAKISLRNINHLKIALPPLKEQERIVKKLDRTFSFLEQMQKEVG